MSEVSRQVLQKHAKSFNFAGLFLPRPILEEAAVVYHFCRVVDDLVDDPSTPSDVSLVQISEALSRRSVADGPDWLKDFLAICEQRQIPLWAAQELIEGILSDQGSVRILNRAELILYSYRVAGCVGVLMCGVLGVKDARARSFAIDLGIAMQLTNISRDVKADALDLGRIYLPATWLEAAGAASDPRTFLQHDLSPVVIKTLDLAEIYYRSGERGLRFIPWRARLAILIASRVYRAIGLKVRRQGADPNRGRAFVSTGEKILRAFQALVLFFKPSVLGLSAAPQHNDDLHIDLAGTGHMRGGP